MSQVTLPEALPDLPDGLKVVPISEIPKPPAVQDTPVLDPAALFRVALRMWEICLREDGVGLAAVQVGIPWRMFVTDIGRRGLEIFLNCSYRPVDDRLVRSIEGCISLPKNASGRRPQYEVARALNVRFEGMKLVKDEKYFIKPVSEIVTGLRGIVYQHETDHQNGLLLSDVGRLFIEPTGGGASLLPA